MSAQIVQFPRKKPLDWDELPDYWGYVEKSYYEMQIEDGVSHEKAFLEWDLTARLPEGRLVLRYKAEGYEDYIARLQSAALTPNAKRETLKIGRS